jgi:translation elongation factor EF-Ts
LPRHSDAGSGYAPRKMSSELLTQPFIKDSTKTVKDLISGAIQKFGERIEVGAMTVSSVA